MKAVLMIIGAFLVLIGAWSAMIVVAVKHAPERITVSAPQPH